MSEVALADAGALDMVEAHDAVAAHTVVLLGNPNVGKTTLFNALTGQNERVGNYPGVTVERRVGRLRGSGLDVDLVDVPGTYSLSARSLEEQVALHASLGINGNPRPSLAIVVVDAGQLVRNLYLVLQLVEFQVPLIIALTMLDEVEDNPPEPDAVGAIFGVRCIAINPRQRHGLDTLLEVIVEQLHVSRVGDAPVKYPPQARIDVDRAAAALPVHWRRNVEHDRAMGTWALLSCHEHDELDVPDYLREECRTVHTDSQISGRDLELELIGARYDYIEANLKGVYLGETQDAPRLDWTERLDRVLLHPAYGFVLFIGIMLLLFQSLFSWADPAISLIEQVIVSIQEQASARLPDNFLTNLLVEGIIGGVGNVIVFLPQILLLFFLVGLLEDSGYMARIAYLMDRVLRGIGLHGRAFVPMLSGLACAVPAIMATRTMERRRDRLLTMMVVPLMTCSARLPVYALIIGALFPPTDLFGAIPVQGLLMVGMYVFGLVTTLVAAWLLSRSLIRGHHVPLLLELPRYRWPSWSTTVRSMWHRTRDFLTEAGTLILGFTAVMWLLLSYPAPPDPLPPPNASTEIANGTTDTEPPTAPAETPRQKSAIEYSLGGRLGHALEPVMAPLGFDWKLTVGVIGAFSAREVFVSTLALVFNLEEADENSTPLRDNMRAETRSDGKPAYPPLVGLSLLVFFALACQCMSTLAVVRRETQSWKWPLFMFTYMTVLAYAASFVVYQGGKLLGFAG